MIENVHQLREAVDILHHGTSEAVHTAHVPRARPLTALRSARLVRLFLQMRIEPVR